jgi:hypothetical protein
MLDMWCVIVEELTNVCKSVEVESGRANGWLLVDAPS